MKKLISSLLSVLILCSVFTGAGITATAADVFTESVSDSDASGKCGDNLIWTYDADTKTLTISGTGIMDTFYDWDEPYCWGGYDNIQSIETVIINGSPTNLDQHAFSECINLTNITIPKSVAYIGLCAFNNCTSLQKIIIPNSVTSIDDRAFRNCSNLKTITIENPNCVIYDSHITIPSDTIICGYKDSTAKEYATQYKMRFVAIDEVMGDLNGDDIVDVRDVTELQKICINMVTPTQHQRTYGDVNVDWRINVRDVTQVQKYCVGMIDSFLDEIL